MSNIKNWSKTASANNSSPPDGAPEGMAPSAVNDTIREQMAIHRTQWEDAEWFDWGHVPVRQSNNSFIVSLTATQVYTATRRLKLFDATTINAEVLSSGPSGANTLVTVSCTTNLTTSLTSLATSILNPVFPGIAREIPYPTITTYTSGGGSFATPAGIIGLRVRMAGGGGGGEGTAGGGNGSNGGTSAFGSLSAAGGVSGGNGGTGGSASGGDINISGGAGGPADSATFGGRGACGGQNVFGGAGQGGGANGGAATNATANTGAGGASRGGISGTTGSAAGGGAGGYLEKWLTSLSASYSYTVGAGGAGGAGGGGGGAGSNGAAGVIIVEAWLR